MEPFFSFWGVVIVALWSANEASRMVDGYFLPVSVCVGIFALVFLAVFRRTGRTSTMLQGLAFGAISGLGLFRLVFLNTYSESDRLGAFICALGFFGLEWAMLTKMKNEMRHTAR